MSKFHDLLNFTEKEDYLMGREIEEEDEDYGNIDHAFQIIAFCEWDDDKELDAQLEIAYAQGYGVEETYIMAAKDPQYLRREMFRRNAPKITYLFKNEVQYTFKIMIAVEALQLEPHEFKWI